MRTGILTYWNSERGYGFIRPSESRVADVFLHVSELRKCGLADPDVGDRLQFELAEGRDGKPRAVDLAHG
jgi:CspA family cold shock protein